MIIVKKKLPIRSFPISKAYLLRSREKPFKIKPTLSKIISGDLRMAFCNDGWIDVENSSWVINDNNPSQDFKMYDSGFFLLCNITLIKVSITAC